MAPSLRRKLYFLSPIVMAALFDFYERLRIRRLRSALAPSGKPQPAPSLSELESYNRGLLADLGMTEPTVWSGPFRGMRYGFMSVCGSYMPRVLGTYEPELQAWIGEAIGTAYDVVVNVGSAEGYYAVGFACAMPKVEVFAYDTDPATDPLVVEMARLNGVEARVHKRGFCSSSELQAILAGCGRPLLFADVEGAEDELLDISRVPALRHADIIVETHDTFTPGVTRRLLDRLWPTHRFDIVAGGDDADRPVPAIVSDRIRDPIAQRRYVEDGRGMPQLYIRFRARSA